MSIYFIMSVGAYAVSFFFMYVWDALPEGTTVKSIVLVLVLGFVLLGAIMACCYGSSERSMTEEEYDKLVKMLEERKV